MDMLKVVLICSIVVLSCIRRLYGILVCNVFVIWDIYFIKKLCMSFVSLGLVIKIVWLGD